MLFTKTFTFTLFEFYEIENGKLRKRKIELDGGLNVEKARAKARKIGQCKQCIEPKVTQFKRTYQFDTTQAKEIKND